MKIMIIKRKKIKDKLKIEIKKKKNGKINKKQKNNKSSL